MNVFIVKVWAEEIGHRRFRFPDDDGHAHERATICKNEFKRAFPDGEATLEVARRYRETVAVR